jgi:hypothetical protein
MNQPYIAYQTIRKVIDMGIIELKDVPDAERISTKFDPIINEIKVMKVDKAYEVELQGKTAKQAYNSMVQALTHKKLNKQFKVLKRKERVFVIHRK